MSSLWRLSIFYCACVHLWRSDYNVNAATSTECVATSYFNASHCSHTAFKNSLGWNTAAICDNIQQQTSSNQGRCRNNDICRKNFSVTVFDQQLFAITMKNTFINALTRCCGSCAKCNVAREVEDILHVTDELLNSSDVMFPVLGDSSYRKLHGFYFIPAYKVPSSYYFTLKKPNHKIVGEVMGGIGAMWPLLVLSLLFAFISGFLVWLIETPKNLEEFPRAFHVGLLHGFWWSFVSMTTVGFGDKVPKSFLGRLFAVIWILLGITMFSMFTAALTTEIINAREPANTGMAGQNVSVMKGRLHDMTIGAEKGAIMHVGTIGHTMRGIEQMIDYLSHGKGKGFLMDRNTYYHFSNRIHEPKYQALEKKWKNMKMVRTKKDHGEETLACGIMLKSETDYNYFKAYFDSNALELHSCNSMRMNVKENENESMSIFSGGNFFKSTLLPAFIILAILVGFGMTYEGWRYYKKNFESEQEKSMINDDDL